MKKIYYKVSSFFTEKRSTIILLLMALSILFIPKNIYALDNNGYANDEWKTNFTSKLNNYFNYDNLVFYSTSSSPNLYANLYFIPLKNSDSVCVADNTNAILVNNKTTYAFTLTFEKLDSFSFADLITTNTSNVIQSSSRRVHSSINLSYCTSGSIFKEANFTYTPPSNDCPTCEVCEECQECEEGGPVEVSNFPFDKTDFYTLLVLIGILIIMLFLKWCFPMKGGKNNK